MLENPNFTNNVTTAKDGEHFDIAAGSACHDLHVHDQLTDYAQHSLTSHWLLCSRCGTRDCTGLRDVVSRNCCSQNGSPEIQWADLSMLLPLI